MTCKTKLRIVFGTVERAHSKCVLITISIILRTMIYHQGLYKYSYTCGKRDTLDCIFVSSS
ncbi:hypothetical protein BAWI5_27500 [Bacillus wiedmannii]